MAESLLSGIADGVLGKIASLAFQEAVVIYGVENQISNLRETLSAIKAVLLDAEEQQAKNHHLQVWLHRLRHVFYDVEDVLDELECEALRKQVIIRNEGVKGKVRRFFSLSNPLILRPKLSHKVKEIGETLSRISIEKDQFPLNERSANNGGAHTRSQEMTYSFVKEADVFDRNFDSKQMIKMLMQQEDDNLSGIPIVGIGGLGKTTLAKMVYNDSKVKKKFKLRIGVSVLEDFDLKKTIEGIIEDATGESLSNLNIQRLQTHLQDIIKDKKYLLVLDDAWSNDCSRWTELRDLLSEGASGSKIIVMTCTSEVTFIMGTYPMHNLERLFLEDSMTLFKKWAFDEKEKEPRPKPLEIGNDIIEKSQGVPLLLKTLGSLLYAKDKEQYWAYIRDSEIWQLVEAKRDLLSILKLSYYHLPSQLKRRFAALSVFPRVYVFSGSDLARLWTALGLSSSTGEKLALEDTGVEYVKKLGRRSLIHLTEVLGSNYILSCKI